MASVHHHRPLLGTFVEISISDSSHPEHVLDDLAEIAFGRIARVQSLMSFHDPSSELSRLNACGHLHPLSITTWTREVIREAARLGKSSEGVFEIAAQVDKASFSILPHQHLPSAPEKDAPSHRDIVFHHDGRISFRRPMRLDLSLVSRGFAVDKASEILMDAGVFSACIKAGGDSRYIGKRPNFIALSDTSTGEHQISLKNPAIATSSAYLANHLHHWRKVNHILHPKTHKPMRSNVSLSVFAQSCVQAEALSNVILLDEPEAWQRLLIKEKASAVLVTSKGEVVRFPHAA